MTIKPKEEYVRKKYVPERVWGPIPNPPGMHTWPELLDCALDEAKKAMAKGAVPVGAIIVCSNGEIIGRAGNAAPEENDPLGHAEILAIRQASEAIGNSRLNDCILVVTLEPCLMCLGAIVHARLKGVVFGAYDEKAGAVISCLHGFDLPFLNHKPWHMPAMFNDECSKILQDFFQQRR